MTSLSDLIPAGGGGPKQITAVANGNITLGQTVALNTNGTVEPVSTSASNVARFVGIAAEAINNSASGKITIVGGVATVPSSVVIGTNYFVTTAGAIADSGSVAIGKALSTTSILMKGTI